MRTHLACRGLLLLLVGALVTLSDPAPGKVQASVPSATPTFTNPLAITNSYAPFQTGGMKVFSGKKDRKKSVIVDTYLAETRAFTFNAATVVCHVLEEKEFLGGILEEVSHNFFAQADDGSVYYFGEVVDVYDENGQIVNHEGSWLVGGATLPSDPADTANATKPGLFMPASPAIGDKFKPEDLAPVVDETGEVLKTGLKVKTQAGTFSNAIEIEETSTLDPGVAEWKWYVPGVGVVKGKTKGENFQLIASTFRQE
jgi:hypothetical protein